MIIERSGHSATKIVPYKEKPHGLLALARAAIEQPGESVICTTATRSTAC